MRSIRRSSTLQALIKKYNGICQICFTPVDLSQPGNHPDSPSKDHIHPKSFGGPIRLMSNLRLTHTRCNHARSDAVEEMEGQLVSCPRCSFNVLEGRSCHGCGLDYERIQEFAEL